MHELHVTVSIAGGAIGASKALRSAINIARLTELHHQLTDTKYGNSPQIARLGALLVKTP